MSTKRPCWSWRYRIEFKPMHKHQMNRLYDFCTAQFGSQLDSYPGRWDITSVRRVNWANTAYWYSRVKLHFKSQEDLVLFKLSTDLDQFYE